jgi:hypothetical protein
MEPKVVWAGADWKQNNPHRRAAATVGRRRAALCLAGRTISTTASNPVADAELRLGFEKAVSIATPFVVSII